MVFTLLLARVRAGHHASQSRASSMCGNLSVSIERANDAPRHSSLTRSRYTPRYSGGSIAAIFNMI